MSGSETDMKLLALALEKVGKEPIDWQVECLCLALLLISMEGDCSKAGGLTTDGFEEPADQLCPRLFATS